MASRVKVPVLSNITVSMEPMASKASSRRTSTPRRARHPLPPAWRPGLPMTGTGAGDNQHRHRHHQRTPGSPPHQKAQARPAANRTANKKAWQCDRPGAPTVVWSLTHFPSADNLGKTGLVAHSLNPRPEPRLKGYDCRQSLQRRHRGPTGATLRLTKPRRPRCPLQHHTISRKGLTWRAFE